MKACKFVIWNRTGMAFSLHPYNTLGNMQSSQMLPHLK